MCQHFNSVRACIYDPQGIIFINFNFKFELKNDLEREREKGREIEIVHLDLLRRWREITAKLEP